ncbi:hypothetical protein FQN51_003919 [Onygenales sp. PD_10]|nr:hypothetical protein FQN51_003919 [Onygenales sp. PD_10]
MGQSTVGQHEERAKTWPDTPYWFDSPDQIHLMWDAAKRLHRAIRTLIVGTAPMQQTGQAAANPAGHPPTSQPPVSTATFPPFAALGWLALARR